MKLALVSPVYEAVPPKFYGGTERVVSYLTEELVALGHDVTLFASGDSVTAAKLDAVWPRASRLDDTVRDPVALHMAMIEHVARRAAEFDVIHIHCDYLAYGMLRHTGVPLISTLHGRLDMPELRPIYDLYPDIPVVSISDSQRLGLPNANYIATVQHGLPEKLLTPGPGTGGYLAFLGRISPEKAPDAAIRIAAASGMPIKIAAKVDKADRDYFAATIAPMLNQPHVEFIGEIGEAEKSDFLGNAAALIFPIDWPEPFGLTMIEALACGTPVIARRRGSVPEIIDDHVTGFVVDDEPQAVAAVKRLHRLDRAHIRHVFDQRFTAKRMALDYLELYRKLSGAAQPRLRVV
ncbi:MAG TPA: glycosyltransferase family 4 protein [Stellaceae bacterium]|jgi:glycosyltransferase involved in cell wall biosynthesis|nr:glycosyltransferase family 4 protein [Stellaceae bacterium]